MSIMSLILDLIAFINVERIGRALSDIGIGWKDLSHQFFISYLSFSRTRSSFSARCIDEENGRNMLKRWKLYAFLLRRRRSMKDIRMSESPHYKLCIRGSMTLEAALMFPIMMMFMAVLLSPLYVMNEQRRLQNGLEAAAKDMSQAAYLRLLSEDMVNKDNGAYEAAAELADIGLSTISVYRALGEVDKSVLSELRLTEAYGLIGESEEEEDGESSLTDSELISFCVEYEPVYPFIFRDLSRKSLSSVSSRRKWIGSKGGRGREKYGEPLMEDGYELSEDGDRIVYVGKNSTRYHKDKGCHYLDNVLKGVDGDIVEELRNSSGARYHACPSCDASPEGTVYIFESGTAYHSSENCKAITAYSRACKLSEVEHLGPCSYCSRE